MLQLSETPTMYFPNRRRASSLIGLCLTLALGAGAAWGAPATGEPILLGVSGPLTGPNAQYGAQWKKGFDLALGEINADGGIGGRPLAYTFEDSQSDPRQSVAIAQKFVNDPRIVAEVGDFSSTASMAASPIYQRAGLVQYGFTNSHPNFTKGGDFMWSPALTSTAETPRLVQYAAKLGLKKVALLYLDNDWGRASEATFKDVAPSLGIQVVASEGYRAGEQDFRSTLVRVRDAAPDGIALISYYDDGAQIVRQLRDVGLKQPVVAIGSVYSPKFIELAGKAAEGVYTESTFFPGDESPAVQRFVQAFKAKYGEEPDEFDADAYDAMIMLATVMRHSGTDRKAIRDGLAAARDVPSVIFGQATFDPTTRRVTGGTPAFLVARNGAFVTWDGTKPANP